MIGTFCCIKAHFGTLRIESSREKKQYYTELQEIRVTFGTADIDRSKFR